jgi:hypothetical protein
VVIVEIKEGVGDMLDFHFQPSVEELRMAKAFSEQIEDLIKQGRFEHVLAEQLLGKYALPDTILNLGQEIRSTQLPKNGNLLESSDEQGPSLVSGVLGITRSQAQKYLKDPKTAHVLFRSLRDKLEEMEDKKQRAAAEDHGFIATVIYTIKKAMCWIIKKFNDIRDDFLDMMAERPAKSSQTKRDYNWLKNKEQDYLIGNTSWYLDSEH